MHHNAAFLRAKFDQALPYAQFVALGESMGHHMQWQQRYQQLALDAQQSALVQSFSRSMNVLCLTGTWCGDCALQGAAMQRIAEGNIERINLRFLLRSDEHADIIVPSQINAGFRVPVTWFMAEDFEPVSRFGDRTLSRYRSMAAKQLGPGAVTILDPPPADPVRAVLSEVLDEFERVQILLRTSTRLRELHGD
ncbi:MAG: thioredoxin family protein [Phycisphaerales bacterium]